MFFFGVALSCYAVYVSVRYLMQPAVSHQPLTRGQLVLLVLGAPAGLWGIPMLGTPTYGLEWIFLVDIVFALYGAYHLRYLEKSAEERTQLELRRPREIE